MITSRRQPTHALHPARRPSNLEFTGNTLPAKPKNNPPVMRPKKTSAAGNPPGQTTPANPERNPRPNPIAIRDRPTQPHADPALPHSSLIAQQHRRIVQRHESDIDSPIVIEVAGCHSAAKIAG